jgi:hypothetical protein
MVWGRVLVLSALSSCPPAQARFAPRSSPTLARGFLDTATRMVMDADFSDRYPSMPRARDDGHLIKPIAPSADRALLEQLVRIVNEAQERDAALAASGRRSGGSPMTANRLLLAAIAALALALAGAAHAQESDGDVASLGEQGFRRFASLCRDQKAACDAAFRFGALVGADAAMRCALADDQIACFKKTMNSQEFMEEERKAITGQTEPKQ